MHGLQFIKIRPWEIQIVTYLHIQSLYKHSHTCTLSYLSQNLGHKKIFCQKTLLWLLLCKVLYSSKYHSSLLQNIVWVASKGTKLASKLHWSLNTHSLFSMPYYLFFRPNDLVGQCQCHSLSL